MPSHRIGIAITWPFHCAAKLLLRWRTHGRSYLAHTLKSSNFFLSLTSPGRDIVRNFPPAIFRLKAPLRAYRSVGRRLASHSNADRNGDSPPLRPLTRDKRSGVVPPGKMHWKWQEIRAEVLNVQRKVPSFKAVRNAVDRVRRAGKPEGCRNSEMGLGPG